MDYDIAANLSELENLADGIKEKRNKLATCINNIYSLINSMQNSWQGESYNTFSNECYSYASSLEALVTLLDAFEKIFRSEAYSNAETFIKSCESAFSEF